MKKLLFLIALCLISCNQNKPKNKLVVSDTIAVEENDKVSATKSKIKPFKETLTYEEAMKTSSIKELKEFMILNFIKSISIRMLTIDEMLAIQGFPANYILNGTKANRTKFIGNSVPPPFVAEWMKTISIALENHIKAA